MSGTEATKTSRPREDGKILFDHELPNSPGNSIIGMELSYPPNGFTPPHRHGGATVVAHVLQGEVLSGMNGNPPQVYTPGQNFIEMPGCHHTVGENNSPDQPAKFIAIFVVETAVVRDGGYEALVVLDE